MLVCTGILDWLLQDGMETDTFAICLAIEAIILFVVLADIGLREFKNKRAAQIKTYSGRSHLDPVVITRHSSHQQESRLDCMDAQMTPDFIFNTLGTIQYFMQSDRMDKANHSLGTFAQLMSAFSRVSNLEHMPLADELQMIQDYVTLMELRFEDQLQIHLAIDEGIMAIEAIIPSLILQPFLQHAIDEGLQHFRDSTVFFHIAIHHKDGILVCDVAHSACKSFSGNKATVPYISKPMSIALPERIEFVNTSTPWSIDIHEMGIVPVGGSSNSHTRLTIQHDQRA